ncbi:sensory transduction histidine kinase [Lentisphaera araneosa HTCC2155]|uniref:histidine kinase n=1 Tax=Lentisphaera araneosa HTCC2155 TaxID=313628 RepID=A6DPS2_9BACT|nr:ATP-binding protein [Lentisphaera araneosa]EDM26367.1 sensory transduction histidine kinase [Lentisphaera araneosa HTCC2155]
MIELGHIKVKSEICLLALRKKFYAFFKMLELDDVVCVRKVSFLSELLRSLNCNSEVEIKIEKQFEGTFLRLELSRDMSLPLVLKDYFTEVAELDGKLILKDFLVNEFNFSNQDITNMRHKFSEKTVEQLLHELELKNEELANHGTLLEEKVIRRTRDAERAREDAEKANVAKSQFLSNMSHELRTPLNGVLGYTQVLQNASDLQDKYKGSLKGIMNCGEHLLTVINDILDISKIEAGKLDLVYDEVDVLKVVSDTEDILRYKALEKGLSLNHSLDPEIPQSIKSDPTKLRQILVNLVGNAVKYTASGGVELKLKKSGDMIKFSIIDTGIGIPKDKQSHVFEAFRQDEGGRQEGGTGLGLAICVKLVEAFGGEIGLESEEGKGSTFWFTHPANFDGVKVKLQEKVETAESSEPVSSEQSLEIIWQELTLDEEWLKDLADAADLGDFSELESLANELGGKADELKLKDLILDKANAFDFSGVQQLIEKYNEVQSE